MRIKGVGQAQYNGGNNSNSNELELQLSCAFPCHFEGHKQTVLARNTLDTRGLFTIDPVQRKIPDWTIPERASVVHSLKTHHGK